MTKSQQYELQALRVDSNQLARMATTINAAMPHHRNAMGSECDHAEVALGALIKERDALAKALRDLAECGSQDHDANPMTRTCSPEDPQDCALCAARAIINQCKP